ncbi:MAG: ribose-phosphate diphosphokinase [Anaerolineae bacterium]
MLEHGANSTFFTPERSNEVFSSPRGQLLIASCRSGAYIAQEIAGHYNRLLADNGSTSEAMYMDSVDTQFSDSETVVQLEQHVGGYDVFLVQGLYNPTSGLTVDQNYMAMFIAARALREHGARHVTAIVPYLAYGRQDKPSRFKREPTTAKLMADLTIRSGIDRIITWEPHKAQIRGFYGDIPTTMLDSLTLWTAEFKRFAGREDVIVVAPDAGASKTITYFGRALNISSAIASKFRPRPEEAEITEIIGDFRDKRVAIVLDDIISSGGTMAALVRSIVDTYNIEEVHIGAIHNLCMPEAHTRIMDLYENYNLTEVVVTDTIPQTEAFTELPFVTVRNLAEVLSRVINRIHFKQSVSELFYSGGDHSAS